MSELRPRSNRGPVVAGIARHGQLKKSSPWPTILKFIGAALVVVLVSGASVSAIVLNQIKEQITTVTLVGETEGPPPSIGAYEGGAEELEDRRPRARLLELTVTGDSHDGGAAV